MSKKTYEKKLYIDMDFDEALERFSGVDPKELPERIKLGRKHKAASKQPAASKHQSSSQNRKRQSSDD